MLENLIALFLGIGLNFLTTFKDRNQKGKRVRPWEWAKLHPYTTALAILAPFSVVYVMGVDQVDKIAALGLGYAGSDATSAAIQGANN